MHDWRGSKTKSTLRTQRLTWKGRRTTMTKYAVVAAAGAGYCIKHKRMKLDYHVSGEYAWHLLFVSSCWGSLLLRTVFFSAHRRCCVSLSYLVCVVVGRMEDHRANSGKSATEFKILGHSHTEWATHIKRLLSNVVEWTVWTVFGNKFWIYWAEHSVLVKRRQRERGIKRER